jgi:predicted Rossmann fold nucleotide-binding protein DprA/Smf involved in DNA uptake
MHDRPHQLSDIERLNRLRLIRSDNIGPRTFASLLRHSGDAASALAHLPDLARRGRAGSVAKPMLGPNLPPAKISASAWSHRAKPAIRRGSPCSTMHRLCSAFAALWMR